MNNEQKAREIFGARAAYYTTSVSHTDQAVLDRVVELCKPTSDAIALDIATGTGHTALAVAPRAKQVIATDITPEMLDQGRKLQTEKGIGNVQFRLASVDDLPFDDGSFDIITCRRAAHHFADIHHALAEMQRVLKPGGRLVIDDRSVPEDDFVDATMNRLDVLHDESHVCEYRPSEWERMLTEAGYEIEVVETYTRHRPLSSLTDNVSPENTARIHEIISALDADQRLMMNVVDKDGVTHINHWFVMIAATRG